MEPIFSDIEFLWQRFTVVKLIKILLQYDISCLLQTWFGSYWLNCFNDDCVSKIQQWQSFNDALKLIENSQGQRKK